MATPGNTIGFAFSTTSPTTGSPVNADSLPTIGLTLHNGVPAQLSAPTGLTISTATTGGSIAASTTVEYEVTALDANGGQTGPSTTISVTTGSTTATNTATVNWSAVSGAASYDVYG
ncbi:MAG: hypothetical protein ACP5I8_16010, partial [Phycisphaerae bacterium]